MGNCGLSPSHPSFEKADDSIHAMYKHDLKRGKKIAYRPRQPHPLLDTGSVDSHPATVATEAAGNDDDLDRLLAHAEHHNDDIDPRDLADLEAYDREQQHHHPVLAAQS